ncbi:MAG: lipoyl(octanoyl) transferase LipB [Gammaproteobacteria bacterium]
MTISVSQLGLVDYATSYRAMLDYVAERSGVPHAPAESGSQPAYSTRGDELWCLQHHPVYTLGKAGKREHLLNPGNIAVVETDRGGQVTYHGPGQIIIYVLLKLKELGLGPRGLVRRIEAAVIESLSDYGLDAARRDGAPGVYLENKKIASLGLRIKNGISYHGVAVNVDLNLEPFRGINPCGYAGLEVTRLIDHVPTVDCDSYSKVLIDKLLTQFDFNSQQRLAS